MTIDVLLRTLVGLFSPPNVRPATLISGFLRRFVDVAHHYSTLKHTLALFNTLFNTKHTSFPDAARVNTDI